MVRQYSLERVLRKERLPFFTQPAAQRLKALVVEDDDQFLPPIEDALFSLGHDLDRATNQADAQAILDSNRYDYVLLDLQIPARLHGGKPCAEFGVNLLRSIRQAYGPAQLPVIIMAVPGSDCVELATELIRWGISELVAKPFPEAGRTLPAIIRDVMSHERRPAIVRPSSDSDLRPFTAGRMHFGSLKIELMGEVIAERTERANYWAVLQRLRERRPDGRFVPARGTELARLFKSGKATENTVSSCISDLRARITERLAARGFHCGRDGVILSGGPGYRLNPNIEVVDDKNLLAGTCGDTDMSNVPARNGNVPAPPAVVPATSGTLPLNERQFWALDQLRQGLELQREHLENQFRVGAKTAKRDLSDLVRRGLIEFARTPRPGCYRLVKR